MEDHEPTPRHSGLRPPNGPPTNTAIGFSPESDGEDFMRDLERRIGFLTAQDSAIEAREIDELRLSQAMGITRDQGMAVHFPHAEREYYVRLREEVENQIALEQMVQRPQRADRLPGSNENGLIQSHEKTLAAIDHILASLNQQIEAAHGEQ